MLTRNHLKLVMPTIRKHLIASYFILWGACSVAVYLLIGKLFFTLMLMLGEVVNNANFAAFILGCTATGAIFALKKQKQYAVPIVVVLVASFYSIFMMLYNMVWDLIASRVDVFASAASLGAGIAGAIMIYAILTDNKEKEESIRTL